jgi:hypothetical protein
MNDPNALAKNFSGDVVFDGVTTSDPCKAVQRSLVKLILDAGLCGIDPSRLRLPVEVEVDARTSTTSGDDSHNVLIESFQTNKISHDLILDGQLTQQGAIIKHERIVYALDKIGLLADPISQVYSIARPFCPNQCVAL